MGDQIYTSAGIESTPQFVNRTSVWPVTADVILDPVKYLEKPKSNLHSANGQSIFLTVWVEIGRHFALYVPGQSVRVLYQQACT